MSSECSVFGTRKFWAVGRFLVLIRCILPGSRSSVERVLYVCVNLAEVHATELSADDASYQHLYREILVRRERSIYVVFLRSLGTWATSVSWFSKLTWNSADANR